MKNAVQLRQLQKWIYGIKHPNITYTICGSGMTLSDKKILISWRITPRKYEVTMQQVYKKDHFHTRKKVEKRVKKLSL